MKPYPAYKDSGIEWIGKIPKHWEVKKLKYIDNVIMGQSPESEDCNKIRLGIPFLQGNADFSSMNPLPSVWCEQPNKIAKEDDVLLSVRAPVGAVNIADQSYGIGRGLCAISPKHSHKKYLYYKALCLIDELNRVATGSTYTAVSVEQVNNVFVPNPDSEEQNVIADFLDHKTAQIDDLIAKKERMIELLKEERTAIINQAVTKGIDPNIEMKDSGIEWLGKIPQKWDIVPIRALCYLGRGRVISNEEIANNIGEYPVYSSQTAEDGMMGRLNTYDFDGEYVTWTTDGANAGTVFYRQGKFNCTNVCGTLKAKMGKVFLRYLPYVLNLGTKCYVRYDINPKLMNNEMAGIRIPLPTIGEQKAIATYLDRKTAQIDAQIRKITKTIEYLKEYRTALISEVVTGKINVRKE